MSQHSLCTCKRSGKYRLVHMGSGSAHHVMFTEECIHWLALRLDGKIWCVFSVMADRQSRWLPIWIVNGLKEYGQSMGPCQRT